MFQPPAARELAKLNFMNKDLKTNRLQKRAELLDTITKSFSELQPLAIHQLGSLAKGNADEFSDLDIWITFPDEDLKTIIKNRHETYEKVSPVLMKYEAPENNPVGGKYTLVIYDTPQGLYQVDYYLAPQSKTHILPEAILLWGDDGIERGEWIMDISAKPKQSPAEKIDFLICLSFIGIKKVMRKDKRFLDSLFSNYQQLKNHYSDQLEDIQSPYTLESINTLLDQLLKYSNNHQTSAIEKIKQEIIDIQQ